MKGINLNLLPIELDEIIKLDESYYQNTSIIKMDEFKVKGKIFYNLSDEVEINVEVKGNIYLEDSITLEEIKYPISLNIEEILEENREFTDNCYEKSKNILDINEFLWENIVLEVPISLTNNSGVNIKGNGWELNKKEDEEIVDSRLGKLKDLFKGGE